jgi:hypothetical protein
MLKIIIKIQLKTTIDIHNEACYQAKETHRLNPKKRKFDSFQTHTTKTCFEIKAIEERQVLDGNDVHGKVAEAHERDVHHPYAE